MAVGLARPRPHPSPGRLAERGGGAPGTQDVSHSAREGPRGADVLTGTGAARGPWCHRSRADPLWVLVALSARPGRATAGLEPTGQRATAHPGSGAGRGGRALGGRDGAGPARGRSHAHGLVVYRSRPALGPTGLSRVAHAWRGRTSDATKGQTPSSREAARV